MGESICLNPEYSTTRRVTHTPPCAQDAPDGKCKCMLSLPAHPGRKGEGGFGCRVISRQEAVSMKGLILPMVVSP